MPATPAKIETRFRYDQDFQSVNAMVPSTIAMVLALIPAILMALAVVREKELGSITNLYVTPVTRLEFVLGKQLPYVALAMISFLSLVLMAVFVFGVPLKGSFLALATGALIYVIATTGYGLPDLRLREHADRRLVRHGHPDRTPGDPVLGHADPRLDAIGSARPHGSPLPMTYFLPISVGAFTKSLGFSVLAGEMALLALFIPALTLISILLLRKQAK